MLSSIHDVASRLYEQTQNKGIEEEVQTVTERIESLVPCVSETSEKLGAMHKAFQQQKIVQEHVVFLREVKSRLDAEFCLDNIQDVEKELENLKVCHLQTMFTRAI